MRWVRWRLGGRRGGNGDVRKERGEGEAWKGSRVFSWERDREATALFVLRLSSAGVMGYCHFGLESLLSGTTIRYTSRRDWTVCMHQVLVEERNYCFWSEVVIRYRQGFE